MIDYVCITMTNCISGWWMQQQQPHNHILQFHTCTQSMSWSMAQQMSHTQQNAIAKWLGKQPCFTLSMQTCERRRDRVSEEQKERVQPEWEKGRIRDTKAWRGHVLLSIPKTQPFPFQHASISLRRVNAWLIRVCRLLCPHVKALSLTIIFKC